MSTKLSKCCVSGHWHKGVAKGSVEDIEGINAYVTGTNKSKTLLAITVSFSVSLLLACSRAYPPGAGHLWLRAQRATRPSPADHRSDGALCGL